MKKYLLPTFIILAVFATGFYFLLNRPSHNNAFPVEKLHLGVYLGEFSSLIWIAEDQGYFADNGLDVTIKEYDSGVPPVKELLAGKVDIATAAEFVVVNYGFDNNNLKIIGIIDVANAIEVIARRDRNIQQISDLRGKKIGLKMKSQAEFLLGTFLAFNHLSLKDIELVDLNQVQMASAISNGDVDAIIVSDPHAYQIKKLLGENAISWPGQSGQDFYFLLITREDIIKDNPLAINRFLKAMIQAEEFIIRENKEAKKIIENRLNTEPTYIQSVWTKNRFVVCLLQDMLIAMEDEAGWMIKNHLTDKEKIPNYFNFIYLDGLKLVKPKGVTVIH